MTKASTNGGRHPVQGHELFTRTEWQQLAGVLDLSPSQLHIVQGIFDDSKMTTIARGLQISPHTARTYLARIYRKLSVHSRPQMIVRIVAEHRSLTLGETETRASEDRATAG